MGIPLAEVVRIGAIAADLGLPGVIGNIGSAALNQLANGMDKEDDVDTPKNIREMKKKRRKEWVEYSIKLEKKKRDKLKKYPEASHSAMGEAIGKADGASLRAIIKGTILETENRIPSDQEINIYAEAVSAAVRGKI